MKVSEALIEAIENSDQTLYRMAKDAGVGYSVLHRFARGERSLNLDSVDKLVEYFGIKLSKPKKRK